MPLRNSPKVTTLKYKVDAGLPLDHCGLWHLAAKLGQKIGGRLTLSPYPERENFKR